MPNGLCATLSHSHTGATCGIAIAGADEVSQNIVAGGTRYATIGLKSRSRCKAMNRKITKSNHSIFVISGGTGMTARQVLNAALAQFPGCCPEVIQHSKVRAAMKAKEIARDAAAQNALVCHSIVDPFVRKAFDEELRALGVPSIDVLGPAIAMLGDHFDAKPRGQAGLLFELHREQLERIEAVDFTLAHDDGQHLQEIGQADVVLVGASRTSKSVTCFYLASRGIRAANVPLIPQLALPRELKRLPRRRVIGLTMNAAHLESIRQARMGYLSDRPISHYAELNDIRAELRSIRDVFDENQWAYIDVSYKATEEVAEQILELMPRKRPRCLESRTRTATSA